jgi:hypothetical protein
MYIDISAAATGLDGAVSYAILLQTAVHSNNNTIAYSAMCQ